MSTVGIGSVEKTLPKHTTLRKIQLYGVLYEGWFFLWGILGVFLVKNFLPLLPYAICTFIIGAAGFKRGMAYTRPRLLILKLWKWQRTRNIDALEQHLYLWDNSVARWQNAAYIGPLVFAVLFVFALHVDIAQFGIDK